MKLNKNIKRLFPMAAMAVSLLATSCVGDLDVDPTINKNTYTTFERDQNFAKIYANMGLTGQQGPAGQGDVADIDEGTSAFYRQLWNMNELPTDEAICSWGDPGVPEFNFATWSDTHGMITAQYYRLLYGVTLANAFLDKTADDNSAETVQERAEARFLRALYYYYAMDFYGNVPMVTKVEADNPPQATRAEMFDFLVKELKECENDMAAPRATTYGRADKAAAWLLLARLYLNAEIYTGTAHWQDAADYAKKVIDSGYSLSPVYQHLFMGDNNKNGAQVEIILPILADGIDTQSYGTSMFLIGGCYKDDMPGHGTSEVWAGNRARKELVNKFFPASVAPNANTEDMQSAAQDQRAMFWGIDRTLDIEKTTSFTEGFSVTKFTNLYAGSGTPRDVKFTDMDVPFMRTAEAYLTYAEAQKRLGNNSEAKTYIDMLKTRAGANTQPAYTLDDICDEWAREFFFEGRRRIDLIRFHKFGGFNVSYKWSWKGGQKDGTNFAAYKNIYAIPDAELKANSNLKQNEGYAAGN